MNDQAASRQPPRAEAYFTPRTPVGREMFARRDEDHLQQRLENNLAELGAQVMLYGDTGVGKTSLLLRVAEEMGIGVARVECYSAKSFQDLIGDAFAAIAELQELRLETSSTKGSTKEGEAGLTWVATMKGRYRSESVETEKREFVVVEQPIIDALVDKLVEGGKRIPFFDNFENIRSDDVKRQIAELMSFISDRARDTGNLKIVLAGIAETASDLLSQSTAASRRTTEFEVPRMPERELSEIIERGIKFLGLNIEGHLVRRIAGLSNGFPYVTHLLGLHVARKLLDERRKDPERARTEIVEDDIKHAIQVSVTEFREEFHTKYNQAKEMSGAVRPREHILRALAQVDGRDYRTVEITELYKRQFNIDPDKNMTFLNVALGSLIDQKYGAVLRRRGSRGRYRYGFANPLMRPFIRLVEGTEESSQLSD